VSDNGSQPGAVEVIEEAQEAAEDSGRRVTLDEILRAVGTRSYGPIYMLIALISLTPLGAVPGSPTGACILLILIASQHLAGRHALWLPQRIERLSCDSARCEQALEKVKGMARRIDKLTRERLPTVTGSAMQHVIAGFVVLLGVSFVPFEFLPFGADIPALALLLIGIGLTAKDGLFVLLGAGWIPIAAGVAVMILRN
jgi:hypothetical protein